MNKERAKEMAGQYGIPAFLAMLLEARGFTGEEELRDMLEDGQGLSDPLLMKDMDKAVSRIRQALEGFEKIAVYGDYDADGVTATAILYTYLEVQGADVIYYIPQREGEGYGMNPGAVESLAAQGVNLIITVDNGISSVQEVELAKSLGMDVVITDHHRPQAEIPRAWAVVDAYQEGDESPFRDFCGAGVVLKLLMALEDGDEESVLMEYADLAALGTIADVVPLRGENRTIVKSGLRSLAQGGRPGVDALLELCSLGGKSPSSTSLAFTAIPRINATGRMGAPERAVQLLISDDGEEAERLAEEICGENEERRRVENQIAQEAFAQLEEREDLALQRVLVVSGADWHPGVIGIVASRIVERYGKPCFVVSETGEAAKGSGRSVGEFSLFDAASACSDVLERFGGHPMAAGILLKTEMVDTFRARINEYARVQYPEMPAPEIHLDCKLNPAALTPRLPEDLEYLEPFGAENPSPLFGLFAMELQGISSVGNGNHLRLTFQKAGASVTCMRFGVRAEDFPYRVGDVLDLAVALDLREFRGESQLTVSIREMKLSSLDAGQCLQGLRQYEAYRRGESIPAQGMDALVPSREDMALVYRLLAKKKGESFSLLSFLGELEEAFSLGKLLVAFEILDERGLVSWEIQGDKRQGNLRKTETKVDLFASPVFQRLEMLKT